MERMVRLIVIMLIYLGLLAGTVILFLGFVWFVRNIDYGWLMLTLSCLLTGGWLFFCLSHEEQSQPGGECRMNPGLAA